MAPAQVPLTPEPDAYAPLKTPEERRRLTTQPSTGASLVGCAAQLLVLLCMAFYVFGEVLVLTPLYSNKIAKNIQGWWGVPKNQPKGGTKGHAEMVRPTYFFLFSVLPLLVIVLLVDFLRKYNARRLTSQALLKVALVLRRKPALFGRVSYWSYGEWLFFAGVVLGNVFVFVRYYINRVNTKKPKGFNAHLECVGLTFGYTCLFNLAFLFLPATRNSAWMEFFNVSYANSVKYHRWLGVVTVSTAFFHCVCYYWVWIREGEWREQALPCFNCDLSKSKVNKRWQYVFGELAFIIFLLMGVTAIPFVRRQFYNLFYYTHQLLFLAVVLLALHWQYTIWWLLPTLVLYCVSRSVSFVNGCSPVEVVEVSALSASLVKVVFKRSPGHDGHYHVGQFLYLNVPAISKLQWHAFTVASSPRADPTTVTVLLKSLGDWTQDLVAHANECKDKNALPTVYVDGFYGASLEMYDEYATVCLVAGGIGVTPILAILRDMVAKLSSGAAIQQKVVFIFAFRELALLEEVAPVLAQLRELDPQQRFVSFHLTLTGSVSDDALDTALAGRAAGTKVAEPTTDAAARRAFSQPLRATSFTSIAAIAAFALSILLLAILEYGTKIKRLNAKLSLLEWFVEICVVLGAAFVAVVAVVVAERKLVGASCEPATHAVQDLSAPFALQSLQVHTYRELLAEFGVAVGAQPDVPALLHQVHAQHDNSSGSAIGLFASGPETLKRAVEVAIAQIDASAFDLREEQFEL